MNLRANINSNNNSSFDLRTNGEMVNLTDIWKGAGSPKSKDPRFWVRNESTIQLIETVGGILNVSESHIINFKKGKGGGSWGHKQIALAYAKYLDPKLHVMVNQVFFERIAEEKNPDLIVNRAIKTYKKIGKDDKWIDKRLKGISKRNTFTSTLAAHGVERDGFKNCTNAIYNPLFGGSTDVVKQKLGIEKKDSIRDNCSDFQLECIEFAEALASNLIKEKNLKGNANCELASYHSSKIVANSVMQSRKEFINKSI